MSETLLRSVMGDGGRGFIIEGIRVDGTVFRPGDWIERLASLASTFGPGRRLQYSPLVQPCLIQGRRSLVITQHLEQQQPEIYRQIVKFALDNQLRIQSVGEQANEPVGRRAA